MKPKAVPVSAKRKAVAKPGVNSLVNSRYGTASRSIVASSVTTNSSHKTLATSRNIKSSFSLTARNSMNPKTA